MNSGHRYAKTDIKTRTEGLRSLGIRFYSGLGIVLLMLFGSVYYIFNVILFPIEVRNSMPYMTPETISISASMTMPQKRILIPQTKQLRSAASAG